MKIHYSVIHPLISKGPGCGQVVGRDFEERTRAVFDRIEKFKAEPFEMEGQFGVAGEGSHLIDGQTLSESKVIMDYYG
jgi:hypothetical protein